MPTRVKKVKLTSMVEAFPELSEPTLAASLTAAWNDQTHAFQENWRNRSLDRDGEALILTSAVSQRGIFAGTLATTEPGGMLRISQDEDGPVLELAQVEANDGTSPVKDVTHFAVEGDYVFVLQEGAGLRYGALSRYLSWLLGRAMNAQEGGFFIRLSDKIPIFEGASDAVSPTSVTIKPSGMSADLLREQDEDGVRRRGIRKIFDNDMINLLLEGAGGGIDPDDVLNATVTFKLKADGRLQSADNLPLAALADEFGSDNVVIKGKNGSIAGEFVRLSHPVEVEMDFSYIAAREVPRAFSVARNEFLDRGVVF